MKVRIESPLRRADIVRVGAVPFSTRLQARSWIRAAAATALAGVPCFAQQTGGLLDLPLDQLTKVEVNIASVKAKPIREQPGVVSLIRKEEISATGARDLMDVLSLVPGFYFGLDVQSVVGPTFRGLWAYEGKTQLILDGIEMNESLYGTVQLGQHIPADAIEQVEIIRGPGSAMYGGTAELAVIRVTTKGASLNGGYATVTPSYAEDRYAVNYNGGLGYTRNDWRISLNASYADTYRSNQRYVARDGTSVDMTKTSDMDPYSLNLGVGWKDLDVRVIYDAYHYEDTLDDGTPPGRPNEVEFNSLLTSAQYQIRATEWLKLTPKLTYRLQEPWKTDSETGVFDVTAQRYAAELNGVADITDSFSLLVGARYYREEAQADDVGYYGRDAAVYFDGADDVAYDDWAVYAQFDLDTPWVNVTVGGRYEDHSYAGGQFVPRVGLTKAWDKFHLKAVYNQAFRTPNISVIADRLSASIDGEQTTGYELEAGYDFGGGVSLVGNLFYMQVEDPIIYMVDPVTGDDGYSNDEEVSSYGVEVELRLNQKGWSGYLGYSVYFADENTVETYQTRDDALFVGVPAHKVSASVTAQLGKGFSWNVNGYYITEREAYRYPATGLTDIDPEFIVNTFVEYRYRTWSLGLGVANLLDEERWLAQPYNGGSGPMPLKGSEYVARVSFKF